MRPSRILVVLTGLVTVVGCTIGGGGEGADDVKQVPRAEALRMVTDYADRVVALTGGHREPEDRKPRTVPCEGRSGEFSETVYYAVFNFQVKPVPAEQQLSTLRRLRDHWRQQGYTIKRDRVFPDETGDLIVANPTDEFEITVASTDPPTALAASVSSPCYRSDEPYPASPASPSAPR